MVRKAWGWTQDDLAQALGNDRQIISYWELDKAKPTRSAMQLLARTLHLSVGALTTGEGFSIPDLPDGGLDALNHAIRNLLPTVESGSIQAVPRQRIEDLDDPSGG
jgi:transcriptional regulator with XRE-family HTH domain